MMMSNRSTVLSLNQLKNSKSRSMWRPEVELYLLEQLDALLLHFSTPCPCYLTVALVLSVRMSLSRPMSLPPGTLLLISLKRSLDVLYPGKYTLAQDLSPDSWRSSQPEKVVALRSWLSIGDSCSVHWSSSGLGRAHVCPAGLA